MASALFRSIFCCCHQSDEEKDILQDQQILDETSRLIPDNLDQTMYGSNKALFDQQQLHQKLSSIVRDKQRKMVNVVSKTPFNLGNRILPPESRQRYYATSPGLYGSNNNISYDDEPVSVGAVFGVKLLDSGVNWKKYPKRGKKIGRHLDVDDPDQEPGPSDASSHIASLDKSKLPDPGALYMSWED